MVTTKMTIMTITKITSDMTARSRWWQQSWKWWWQPRWEWWNPLRQWWQPRWQWWQLLWQWSIIIDLGLQTGWGLYGNYLFFAFVFVEDPDKQNIKNNKNTKKGKKEKDNLGERAVCGLGGHDWHWEDHVSQYLHGAGDHRYFDHHVCDHMVMILWPCPF